MATDLWFNIKSAELENNFEKVMEYFNEINAEELNKFTNQEPSYILLHALIDFFDENNQYPELLGSIFEFRNVDAQDVNINFKHPLSGTTALILAASRGNLKLVQHLILWKADPHIRSNNQETAFSCSILYGNVEIAQFLSAYVTKEELELKDAFSNRTPREILEGIIYGAPTEQKYQDLLDTIDAIELRHLIEDKIVEDDLMDDRLKEHAQKDTNELTDLISQIL